MRALLETVRGTLMLCYYLGSAVVLSPLLRRTLRRNGQAEAKQIVARVMRRAFAIGGVTWRVEGRENLPDGAYVLLHNETSFVDLMLLHGVVLTELADTSMGAAVWRWVPGSELACRVLNIHMFVRGDREDAERALQAVLSDARAGARVTMSGSGRLSRDGEVQHFKRGGALIAIRAGLPVVPMSLTGGHEICPPGSVRVRPGTVHLRFGAPISTNGLTEEDAPDLAGRAREVVVAQVREDRPQRCSASCSPD